MTTPTIAEYLKYADLQVAAESFLRNESTKELVSSRTEEKGTEGLNFNQ